MTEQIAAVGEKAYKLAFEYEKKWTGCSQCVLLSIQETFGLKMGELVKAAHGLGGGNGLSDEGSCGALAAGIMALSSLYGRDIENMSNSKGLRSYRLSKELHHKFVEEFGSCVCKEVQKKILGKAFNLWDAGEYEEFEKAGGHVDKCTDVVGKVARWTAEIIQPLLSHPP